MQPEADKSIDGRIMAVIVRIVLILADYIGPCGIVNQTEQTKRMDSRQTGS